MDEIRKFVKEKWVELIAAVVTGEGGAVANRHFRYLFLPLMADQFRTAVYIYAPILILSGLAIVAGWAMSNKRRLGILIGLSLCLVVASAYLFYQLDQAYKNSADPFFIFDQLMPACYGITFASISTCIAATLVLLRHKPLNSGTTKRN